MNEKPNGELTSKPKKLAAEEVTALLKSGAKKRRVSRAVIFLYLLVISALPIGLFLWWFWPQPSPPPMLIVAFDQLCVPGEEATLHAQLEPKDGNESDMHFAGWPVLFREVPPTLTAAHTLWQEKTKSDAAGSSVARWKTPGEQKVLAFAARYAPESKTTTAEDRGWVYLVPADAALLLVDVEHSLAKAALSDWDSKNVLTIPGQAEAMHALSQAVQKKKLQAVYLACAAPSAGSYRKVRGWVQSVQLKDGTRLPPGPVLGKEIYSPNQDAKTHIQKTAQAIREKFKGKLIAATANADTAAAFQDGGLPTFLIGDAAAAKTGITTLKNWSELTNHLKQNQ